MSASRVFRAAVLGLIPVAVLDALLWKLEVSRISPVLIHYTVGPEPGHQEGYLVLSVKGILVWMTLIALWAGISTYVQRFPSRPVRAATMAALSGMQSLTILIFDPYLLLLILGGESAIRRFLRRWEVLAEIYDHWGLSQNFHWLFACQLAGTLAVLAAAHLLEARNGANDSGSLSDQDAPG